MEIQVLRKKSRDDSKEIVNLKYQNEDLQCCLMSTMEDVDLLKKQIQKFKKNNKHSASSEVKSKNDTSSSMLKQENLKMKTEIADLKSTVHELNAKLLKADHQNDDLQKSNLTLMKKVDILRDQPSKRSSQRANLQSFRS